MRASAACGCIPPKPAGRTGALPALSPAALRLLRPACSESSAPACALGAAQLIPVSALCGCAFAAVPARAHRHRLPAVSCYVGCAGAVTVKPAPEDHECSHSYLAGKQCRLARSAHAVQRDYRRAHVELTTEDTWHGLSQLRGAVYQHAAQWPAARTGRSQGRTGWSTWRAAAAGSARSPAAPAGSPEQHLHMTNSAQAATFEHGCALNKR